MEKKVVEFKKGDIIVSGRGNMGIFNGVVDGFIGERLTAYCESSAPAGTDLRYARHATDAEKKFFFDALKENGLVWNPDEFAVKHESEDWIPSLLHEDGRVNWKAEGMHPFKVVGEKKKRIRPTWTQVRELENTIWEQKKIIEKMKALFEEKSIALEKANQRIRDVYSENLALTSENTRLRNRGFLDRLLNK